MIMSPNNVKLTPSSQEDADRYGIGTSLSWESMLSPFPLGVQGYLARKNPLPA